MTVETLSLKRRIVVSPAHENGRFCGCDPPVDHVCEGHAGVHDESESIIDVQQGEDAIALRVTGPVDGCLTVRQGRDTIVMHRFIAEQLIAELDRRLGQRV